MDRYTLILPDNHPFKSLVTKAVGLLNKGENVLVGGVHGVGAKTFLNLFSYTIQKNKTFDHFIFLPASDIKTKDINDLKNMSGKKVVVFHSFELLKNKKEFIEMLHQLRQPENELVYLAITDHEIVSRPKDYFGSSSPVFSHRIILTPFNLEQTRCLIEVNEAYYGWKISLPQYERVYELTGGIPRLIKHVCKLISESNYSLEDTELEEFFLDPVILFELQILTKIIFIISKTNLEILGISSKGKIRSILLQKYFEKYCDELVVQFLPTLTNLERKLFVLLQQNSNSVVTQDQIGDLFELFGREFSPWAIYKLISRLKPKIPAQFNLKSIKDQGYILSIRS